MTTNSLHKDLLEFVACPLTHQAVREAEPATLARVNAKIASGACTNAGGEKVSELLTEALVTVDGQRLYPIREGIPVMLIDESLLL